MVKIKNNTKFYDLLHELEDSDPNWFENVGEERNLNQYIDDGAYDIPVEKIYRQRDLLKQIRMIMDTQSRSWKSNARRAGIRLYVTFYRQYGLSYEQISKIMDIPNSTLRHDYAELGFTELLKDDYRISLVDRYGNILSQKEI